MTVGISELPEEREGFNTQDRVKARNEEKKENQLHNENDLQNKEQKWC